MRSRLARRAKAGALRPSWRFAPRGCRRFVACPWAGDCPRDLAGLCRARSLVFSERRSRFNGPISSPLFPPAVRSARRHVKAVVQEFVLDNSRRNFHARAFGYRKRGVAYGSREAAMPLMIARRVQAVLGRHGSDRSNAGIRMTSFGDRNRTRHRATHRASASTGAPPSNSCDGADA